MTGVLLIIAGIVIGGHGARAVLTVPPQRPTMFQGSFGTLLMYAFQWSGLVMLIYGVVLLFS